MNAPKHNFPGVLRRTRQANFEALFSLSQTQRRLAHRYKGEAMNAEAEGNLNRYVYCRRESDRLWSGAKFHLQWARQERPTT